MSGPAEDSGPGTGSPARNDSGRPPPIRGMWSAGCAPRVGGRRARPATGPAAGDSLRRPRFLRPGHAPAQRPRMEQRARGHWWRPHPLRDRRPAPCGIAHLRIATPSARTQTAEQRGAAITTVRINHSRELLASPKVKRTARFGTRQAVTPERVLVSLTEPGSNMNGMNSPIRGNSPRLSVQVAPRTHGGSSP